MTEVLQDSKSFIVGLEEVPDLSIISVTPPSELVQQGVEVAVSVTIENTGADTKYKIKLIDVEGSDQGLCGASAPGEIIDEEPNTYIIGDTIQNGEQKTQVVNTNGWCGAMPGEDWPLKVEVYSGP